MQDWGPARHILLQPVFHFVFIVVVTVHDQDPGFSAHTFHGLSAGYSGLLRRVPEKITFAWREILAIRMYLIYCCRVFEDNSK